ncbi:ankyrin repeat-containing protein At2g01680 [Magnolia sinica]|uniref:ankyrin repeat-containing protein At2g01680 n=1 Tax=Magnolia sinica TaxID=86752 RepID=UPI00265A41B6|nr:ankyrin repeat-containing protein At2g01680 [Magnolia sinica]
MNSRAHRLISPQILFSTVRSGDLSSLRLLLEGSPSSADGGGADLADDDRAVISSLVAQQNGAGETALYIAADNNLEEIFSYLLGFCDLETALVKTTVGINAFHIAAKNGNLGIVKELLSHWPELCNSCDNTNTSPLYSAAVKDHLDVVNAILDADGTAARVVRKNGKTSLHTAARIGYYHIVKALLDRDPEIVSIKDKKGQTALHMAVKGKNTDVVEEMLVADLSILNMRDRKGNTALHIATRKWRPQMVQLLLSYESIDVNVINNQHETAMDLAEKIPYGDSAMEITEALAEAGAKHARNVGKADEAMDLTRTVSEIKHEVRSQFEQNAKTNKRMSGIAKELRKLHREAVQNTTNSVTLVAVLIASIAFMAIFNLPGLYNDAGKANVADEIGFRVFYLLNATALFISLAVVVVQITLVAWETSAQKQVISVVNKLMWAASLSICGAFLSLSYVVVGSRDSWMATTITVVGGSIMIGTLASLCYLVLRQHVGKFGDDSQRRIRRASASKSFSWSVYSALSDPDEYNSDHEKIYAL